MGKFKPGIPDNFSFDVAPVRDLGDYLDEPSPTPQRRPKTQVTEEEVRGVSTEPLSVDAAPIERIQVTPTPQTATPAPTIERPAIEVPIELHEERVVPRSPTVPPVPTAPVAAAREPVVNEDIAPRAKAPRREISMTPDTLRMSDELLEVIRSGSGQRDTKANELFHALVLLVHEAMDELDPHTIPKRGRWGTPTARAYPIELKNAFMRALLRKHRESSDIPSALRYSVNDAA